MLEQLIAQAILLGDWCLWLVVAVFSMVGPVLHLVTFDFEGPLLPLGSLVPGCSVLTVEVVVGVALPSALLLVSPKIC